MLNKMILSFLVVFLFAGVLWPSYAQEKERTEYWEDGTKKLYEYFDESGYGVVRKYDKEGQIKEKTIIEPGMENTKWFFDDEAVKKEVWETESDRYTIIYTQNGSIKTEITEDFADGKQIRTYYKDGRTPRFDKEFYEDGSLKRSKTYNSSGRLVRDTGELEKGQVRE